MSHETRKQPKEKRERNPFFDYQTQTMKQPPSKEFYKLTYEQREQKIREARNLAAKARARKIWGESVKMFDPQGIGGSVPFDEVHKRIADGWHYTKLPDPVINDLIKECQDYADEIIGVTKGTADNEDLCIAIENFFADQGMPYDSRVVDAISGLRTLENKVNQAIESELLPVLQKL